MKLPRKTSRQVGLLAVLVALSVVVAIHSYGVCFAARTEAAAAQADGREAATLARSIEMLRTRPSIAGSREVEVQEMTRQIESAVSHAQMPREALARIAPEPLRRVGETAYKEAITQVQLRRVTLPQLLAFLHSLSADEDTQLQATTLRLTSPRDEQSRGTWTAEVALSYLIYAPVKQALSTGGKHANESK